VCAILRTLLKLVTQVTKARGWEVTERDKPEGRGHSLRCTKRTSTRRL
jgi:hypothetical protein